VLTEKQKWALEYVQQKVFSRWMRTGVQFAINVAVFKLLRMNAVYPVEDEKSLSDHDGNVLPDVFLMPQEATVADLAREIHSDLAKTLLHAIDARTGLKMPKEYVLRDRDVIKIVATSRRG
ncbi:MAG: TGS domain-containing protein, partial [Candidatus Bathyarchaeia archaeon]